MYFDTHAHVNFNDYEADADAVIQKALNEDVWMLNVGSTYKSSKIALDLANRYEKGVYAAVGLHPISLFEFETDQGRRHLAEDFNYDVYEKLAKFEKATAIGEIGLDYFHLRPDLSPAEQKERQKQALWDQLRLARSLDKPALIHCRQAHDDMLDLIKDFRREFGELIPRGRPWAVMHCFSGNEDLAWQYFGLGLIISFTGLITFSRQYDEMIRRLPLDKFIIETDCPYMTPEPFRGQRNEPLNVKYVARRVAEIKNLSEERVAEMTTRTARDFLGV